MKRMNVDRDSGMGVIGPHHHPSPMPLNPPQARNSREAASFNQALQRTRSAVTLAASCRRLSPTTQPARQLRESLSLGSFGDATRVL
jgi:hypothetical protein